MRRLVRLGPLVFRDPLLLCGALYLLLWFDASGFLRIGLCAAVLHEMGQPSACPTAGWSSNAAMSVAIFAQIG